MSSSSKPTSPPVSVPGTPPILTTFAQSSGNFAADRGRQCVTSENVANVLAIVEAFIVASASKVDGHWWSPVAWKGRFVAAVKG
jgi:hypothetical protein